MSGWSSGAGPEMLSATDNRPASSRRRSSRSPIAAERMRSRACLVTSGVTLGLPSRSPPIQVPGMSSGGTTMALSG